MNLRAFPLLAVVVLSAVGKIWTWWGIAIMAACLVGGLLAAVAAQQRGYTVTGSGEVEEEDDAVLGYFCVTVPAFAAAIIGSVIWAGWGAAIGGVGAALVLSFAYAAVSERMA
jgi:hypothetical protein